MSNRTVPEIKEELTNLGVEFDDKLNKPELLKILDKELSKGENEEAPTKTYVVVHDFKDLKDNNRVYTKDGVYPAEGAPTPTEARIKELSSIKNKLNRVLIKEQG